MSESSLDLFLIPVLCGCGHKNPKSVTRIIANDRMTCEGCHAVLQPTDEERASACELMDGIRDIRSAPGYPR